MATHAYADDDTHSVKSIADRPRLSFHAPSRLLTFCSFYPLAFPATRGIMYG